MAANKKNQQRVKLTVAAPVYGKGGRPAAIVRYAAGRIKNIGINLLLFALIVAGTYIEMDHHRYTHISIVESKLRDGEDSDQYRAFKNGVIRYNKDGVAYLLNGTHEQWIQAAQMKTPAVDVCGNAFAVYDVGGNSIYVFESSGLKGEIKTAMPVEKVSVSGQGIVAALLKDQESPVLIVYDAVGNVLAKQQINAQTEGYPTAMRISADGYRLVVSYAGLSEGSIQTETRLYSFLKQETKGNNSETNEPQLRFRSDGLIGDIVLFENGNMALVSENGFYLFKRGELDRDPMHISFDTSINSLCYDDKRIGFLMRDMESEGGRICLYDAQGKVIFSKPCKEVYDRVELIRDRLILKGETEAAIVSDQGEYKFEGDLKDSIITIVPGRWMNQYGWFNKSGYRSFRLK